MTVSDNRIQAGRIGDFFKIRLRKKTQRIKEDDKNIKNVPNNTSIGYHSKRCKCFCN